MKPIADHKLTAENESMGRFFWHIKNFYTQYDQRRGKNFEETFRNSLLIDWYRTL
jgi:hypothetical protein